MMRSHYEGIESLYDWMVLPKVSNTNSKRFASFGFDKPPVPCMKRHAVDNFNPLFTVFSNNAW